MKNHRKIIYPLTALLLAFVLAACAGTRNLESVEITGEDGASVNTEMFEGNTQQLELRAHYDNGTTDGITNPFITWESDNEDVLTVNNDTGVVTAESEGIATITALHSPASEDQDFDDYVTITVLPNLTAD